MYSDLYKFVLRAFVNGSNVTKQVYPLFGTLTIDENSDEYAISKSLSGDLSFVNKPKHNIYDFDFIKDCEGYNIGTRVNVDIYLGGALKFQGYFYPYQCRFDDDICVATVKVLTDDAYSCLTKNYDEKINILSEVDAWGLYRINPTSTFFTFTCQQVLYCDQSQGGCVKYIDDPAVHGFRLPFQSPASCQNNLPNYGFYSDMINLASATLQQQMNTPFATTIYGAPPISFLRVISSRYEHVAYDIANCGVATPLTHVTTVWGFESVITANDPDTLLPVPPGPIPAEGWIDYHQFNLNGILVTRWVRQPYFDNPVYNYALSTDICNYQEYSLIDPDSNDSSTTSFIYRGRNMNEVIQMFLDKTGCGLTYQSEFFNSTINPVTGLDNKLKYLQVNNCSDIKDPGSSEPATLLESTFKDFLEGLADMFNVHWHISGNKFVIEHLSYFENGYTYGTNNQQIIDLRTYKHPSTKQQEILASDKYGYNIEDIYNKEVWVYGQYVKFDFSPIYVKYNLETENTELNRTVQFVTDIEGLNNVPDQFSNSAIVLVAIEEQIVDPLTGLTGFYIVNEIGVRTTDLVVNGHLCLSNLIDKYWKHGRILIEGELNGVNETFESTTNKKVQEVSVTDCDDDINVADRVITNLGTGTVAGTNWDIVTKVKTIEVEI